MDAFLALLSNFVNTVGISANEAAVAYKKVGGPEPSFIGPFLADPGAKIIAPPASPAPAKPPAPVPKSTPAPVTKQPPPLLSDDLIRNYIKTFVDNSTANVAVDIAYNGPNLHEAKRPISSQYESVANMPKRDKKWESYMSPEHKRANQMKTGADLARNLKSDIHNKLLQHLGKATANKVYYDDEDEDEDDCDESPSTSQGSEHRSAKSYMRQAPIDMNEYIRKDSIPCWGCNLEH
jgi:hypothetical protein